MLNALSSRYQAYARDALAKHQAGRSRHYHELLGRAVAPGDRVLHLGCGRDRSRVLRALPRGCRVTGIDWLRHAYPGPCFVQADAARLPLANESFDAVACEYLFEHLQQVESVFAELSRVVRPGGRLLALTPNLWSYKSLAAAATPYRVHRLAARTLRPDAREAEDVHPTYYRLNTHASIWIAATTHGWSVREFRYLNNGPTWFQKLPGLFELGLLYHRELARRPALRSLRCAILVDLERRDATRWLREEPASQAQSASKSSRIRSAARSQE